MINDNVGQGEGGSKNIDVKNALNRYTKIDFLHQYHWLTKKE